MAASTDWKEYVDELTKCPICLENLVNPKSLPCLHTFCLRCIRDHCRDSAAAAGRVDCRCPVCRSEFVIPVGGVEQLPDNFLLKGLTDFKTTSDKDPYVQAQDDIGGITPSSITPASTQCNGCGQTTCSSCIKPHQMIPDHDAVPHERGRQNEALMPQGNFCRRHPGNRLDAYCYECDGHGCVECHAVGHRQNDIDDHVNYGYDQFGFGAAAFPHLTGYSSASVTRGGQQRANANHHANQMNPNSSAYHSRLKNHANQSNPSSSAYRAAANNRSNQMNPNHSSYRASRASGGGGKGGRK